MSSGNMSPYPAWPAPLESDGFTTQSEMDQDQTTEGFGRTRRRSSGPSADRQESLVNAFKKSLHRVPGNDNLSIGAKLDESKLSVVPEPSIMKVKVSKVPKSDMRPKYNYPYKAMPSRKKAHRGFPVNDNFFKQGSKWQIQIVSSSITPTEPMPSFPQQSGLRTEGKGEYVRTAPRSLNKAKTLANSGEVFWQGKAKPPQSSFFFAAGDPPVEKVQKPHQASIYHSVVAGRPGNVSMFGSRGE